VTGRAKLECMVSMNYSAGQQIKHRPTQEAPLPAGHCPAVAKLVSHLIVRHWRPPMNTTATARILLLTRLLPRGRVGASNSAGAPGRRTTRASSCKSNRSHSFMNSPLLITAIHCFDHSRVILFISLPHQRHSTR